MNNRISAHEQSTKIDDILIRKQITQKQHCLKFVHAYSAAQTGVVKRLKQLSMSVLFIVGPKCTLAASHAAPW